jgi:hypothetical protein
MRKTLLAIPAVLLVFSLMVTGCEQPVAKELSSEAIVSSVTIAGVEARLGAPSTTWNEAEGGIIFIPDDKMEGAEVSANAKSDGIVYFASTPSDMLVPNFVESTLFSFEDSDIFYVEVFSANHDAYNIYKIQVRAYSRLAALESLTINGLDAPFGYPGEAWDSQFGGQLYDTAAQFYDPDLPKTWNISITTTPGSNAVVEFARAPKGVEPTGFTTVPPASFDWGDYLYVKVTSEDGNLTYYFKTKILFSQEETIQWGQPDVTVAGVIDPIWNNTPGLKTFDVSSVYPVDSTAEFIENPDTSAWAKVLWDHNGIYVLMEVIDPDPCTLPAVTGNQHLYDSVEIFTNPNRPAAPARPSGSYGTGGGQYRIGSQGTKSGSSSTFPGSAWLTENGYMIQARVPWANTADNGTRIGFDITVNVAHGNEPSRYGVLAWNNVISACYNNSSDYGAVTFAGRQRNNAKILDLAIGGKTATLGTPGANYANAVAGVVTIGSSQSSNPAIVVIKADNFTTLRYANATDNGSPNFSDAPTFTIGSGDYVYIEAKAQDNMTVLVYKIQVLIMSDDTALTAITIAGQSGTLGTAAATFTGATVGDNQLIQVANATALNSVSVSATTRDSSATVKYGHSATNVEPVWATGGTLTDVAQGGYIGIQVTAPDGTIGYYKYRIAYGSSSTTLSSITVGGVSAASLGTPGVLDPVQYGAFTGVPGTVTLTADQAGGSEVIVAVTGPSGATYRYDWGGAFYGSNYSSGSWNTTGAGLFAGGDLFGGFVTVAPGVNNALIFVEVTSENGVASTVYALSCTVSN